MFRTMHEADRKCGACRALGKRKIEKSGRRAPRDERPGEKFGANRRPKGKKRFGGKKNQSPRNTAFRKEG